MFDISLKARILREWQKAAAARQSEFSERDMLVLEIAHGFGPITETEIRTIFGLSPSFISELVKSLRDAGLVEREDSAGRDVRAKPLTLTAAGKAQLERIKTASAQRFEYLLSETSEEEQELLAPILEKIKEAATRKVREMIFGEYT